MCGRFALNISAGELVSHFGLDALPDLPARYNIAPGQDIPIIRFAPGVGRRLESVRWGLIPAWSRDPSIGHRLINARAETVHQKPAFRDALRQRRCIIPASGFFEWEMVEGRKCPWWIHRADGQPMGLAGLWEHWDDPTSGHPVESCTIVTRPAVPLVAPLHDRMPAILPKHSFGEWLGPGGGPEHLHDLLLREELPALRAYPVSPEVNSPKNDHPGLLLPL